MNLKNSFALLLSGLVGTALLSAPSWAGGAYNGPVLEGDAIPGISDRAIPVQKITDAIGKCRNEMLQPVVEAVYGKAEENPVYRYSSTVENFGYGWSSYAQWFPKQFPETALLVWRSDFFGIKISEKNVISLGTWIEYRDECICQKWDGNSNSNIECSAAMIAECHSNAKSFVVVRARLDLEMPGLVYRTQNEPTYDDYGNEHPNLVALDLRLVPSKTCMSDHCVLINHETKKRSKFFVNMLQYKDCLIHEISK